MCYFFILYITGDLFGLLIDCNESDKDLNVTLKWRAYFHGASYFDTLKFKDAMNSLWIKPTNALNSNFIGITTLHVSGSLSAYHQEFLAVHRLWYILCSCDNRLLPGVGWYCSSILLLVANGHNCIKCTKAEVRLRTPDDGQKGCPKHVE